MGRIVPAGYVPEDSDTVRALGEYVQTLRPEWVRPEFGTTFVEFISERGPALREKYGIDKRDHWHEVPPWKRPPAAGGPSGIDPRLSYVFYEKLSPQLRKTLIDSKIALPDADDPRWIGMHPKLTQVYMTALADQLAGQHGLYPLTDETVDHMAMGGCTVDRLAQLLLEDVDLVTPVPETQETEGVAAYLALETVLPKNIEDLPIDKILDFREKYPRERAEFQKQIAAFVKAREWLSDIQDPEVLANRIQAEYDKEFRPKLQQLREQLQEVNIDTVCGALSLQVTLPSMAMLGSTLFGVAAPPVAIFGAGVAGASLAVIRILRDRRKAQQKLGSAPLAYMMRVEEDLQPSEITHWIGECAKRFRFWR